ncbi:restriction endonuclease subunit S [Aliarcobacter lanthieri]|uniref:restriction endonuclease subunit S n=1 Tax=Aliarcobacter lanthieri TaxID=1355374 RepID=UPI00047B5CED|nr:restriction endonuclease subunit S [Aliarcobacter lanthieri]QKF59129.1 type I restriction/modification system, specificity subunit [Aliarcobacter lanthieri]
MVNLKDWQEINIGSDTTLKARIGWQGLTTGEYKDSGEYYLVTGTDFENGLVNWDTCHFVNKWRFDQDKNIQLKVNDVLITKDGTIGKAGFIDTIKLPTTLNSGVFVIRTNSNKLDQKYLYYIFTSEIFVEFLNRLTAGSTINHLYQKDFIHFTFKAPNIEEQKAIAKALSDTDELITTLEKLISKKEAIKQGTMQQLLTGKKRLSGFSDEWEEKGLGEIAIFRRGSFPQPYGLSKWYDESNGLPFIQVYDVDKNMKLKNDTKQHISDIAKKLSVFVKKGTVILTIQGSIGRIAITQYDAYIDRTLLIFTDFLVQMDKIFFSYVVQELFRIEKEKAAGGTIKTITKEELSSFSVMIPRFLEQQAIAQILSDMDNEIEILKSKLSKTKAIKDGIISELLTGKTRLKVKDE